jgi:hypothetical protein
MSRFNLVGALALLAPLAWSSSARGAEALFTPACTTENLLARKQPVMRQDTRGNPALVTDEAISPEGAQWDSPVAVLLDTPAGSVTYDLGQATSVSAFFVQADANDSYKIFGSSDGAPRSFKLLVEVDTVTGHGLRGRTVSINPTMVRFLRIGEGLGDNFYSISEFAAYCHAPTPFPPAFRRVDAPPARVPEVPWWKFTWWENDASARFEMGLAIAGLALLAWGFALRRKGTPEVARRLRNGLLITLGVLSLGAYWNFGFFHFRNYIHVWDTYHYYIGSKYFNELSYDRLYECASVADSESPGLRRRVELRKIMNLRTNMLGGTADILAHPERCKQHFTPERWESFKQDIAYFRTVHGVKRWEEAQTDHGYNGTPVWNIVGTTLANTAPAGPTQVFLLALIDPAFALGMLGMIWWAFGWRTLCIALIVFASNFPSRFYWTGGAYLRWDWLFYLVGGICLIRRDRLVLGGFFLAYSTLLRIFPLFVFVGPLMVLAQEYHRTRKIDPRYRSVIAGAALAVLVLVPLSLIKSGGIDGYRHFAQNTAKHASTPLTNYMGLRTLIAYKPSEAGRILRSDKIEDPWGAWKIAKLRTFHEREALYLILAVGFAALVWFAVRGVEPWVACALSATLIAVGAELTCYYYSFLVAVALLYEKRRETGLALLAVTATTGFIDLAPTRFLPNSGPWIWMKMPTWLDEQYMWMAVVTLIGFGWILYRFGFVPEAAPAAAGARALAAAGGSGPGVRAGDSGDDARDDRAKAAAGATERRAGGAATRGRRGSSGRKDRRKKR